MNSCLEVNPVVWVRGWGCNQRHFPPHLNFTHRAVDQELRATRHQQQCWLWACFGKFMAVIYWLENIYTGLHTSLIFPINESVLVVEHTKRVGKIWRDGPIGSRLIKEVIWKSKPLCFCLSAPKSTTPAVPLLCYNAGQLKPTHGLRVQASSFFNLL